MSTGTIMAGPAVRHAAREPRTAFVLAGGAALGAVQALEAAVHSVNVLTNARLQGDLTCYAHSAELIVLPAVNSGHIPPTDFGHADQLISETLTAARTALAEMRPAGLGDRAGSSPSRVLSGV
jgi:hypothetical protein